MRIRDAISLFRGHRDFHLDLIGRRRWWFVLSAALLAVSFGGLFIRQLNLGIDFEGGALLRYTDAEATADRVRDVLSGFGRGDAIVQIVNGREVTIRTEPLGDQRAEILEALSSDAGIAESDISLEEVGPRWGEQISRKALQGLVIFLIVVTIYITLRFEWKMAIAAIVALFHDLVITAGVYALVGREVTPETVIAILTILGYSLYDTVVIFDKVKENTESLSLVARETYSGTVNLSLNQVMMRSVNTSLATLLPIGTLLFLGGDTLKNFAFALFIGVASGTYSSIFVAAPVLAVLKEREPRLAQLRTRAERRAERPSLRAVPSPAGEDPEEREELAPVSAAVPRAASAAARPAGARRRTKKKPRAKRRGKR